MNLSNPLGSPLQDPMGIGIASGSALTPTVIDVINLGTGYLSQTFKGPTRYSKYRVTVVGPGGAGFSGDVGGGGGGGGAASTDVMSTNGILDLSLTIAPATVLGGTGQSTGCVIAGFGNLIGGPGQNGAVYGTTYYAAPGGTASGGVRNFPGGNGGMMAGPTNTPFAGSGGGGAAGTFGTGGNGGNVIDRSTAQPGFNGSGDGGGGGGASAAQTGGGGGGGIGSNGSPGDYPAGTGVTLIDAAAAFDEVFVSMGLKSTSGFTRAGPTWGGRGGIGGGGGGGPGYNAGPGAGGTGGCGLVRIELWP